MDNLSNSTSLWVFGYGSLCWNPGFHPKSSVVGYLKNYVRRFWHGNTTHRGKPGKPGRVATLIHEEEGLTWGVVHEITGEAALDYLNKREITLGGYKTVFTLFHPRDSSIRPFTVLVYIATPSSSDWAGPAPLQDIASQIISSSGPKGHNVEYLLKLSNFMRETVPEMFDTHLYGIETIVRERIKDSNMCLKALMGDDSCIYRRNCHQHSNYYHSEDSSSDSNDSQCRNCDSNDSQCPNYDSKSVENDDGYDIDKNVAAENVQLENRASFTFASSLPTKQLKCLKA